MPLPSRIPILYVIIGVLILVSTVPLYFYGTNVVESNRDRLITNERLLQNTVTRSLSEAISQRQKNIKTSLGNLAAAMLVASDEDISGDHVNTPELRRLLESFVSSSSDSILYATLLNDEAKGISAGTISLDAFMQRELEHAFENAAAGKLYTGQALSIGAGKNQHTTLLMSIPITTNDRNLGMLAAVIDLQFLARQLQDAHQGGLAIYVVDRQGRLVAGSDNQYVTGQDLTENELVKDFVEQGTTRFAATSEYNAMVGKKRVRMLGTLDPVPALEWAVIAQKSQEEAYSSVYEMQQKAKQVGLLAIALSLAFGIFAARRIATPLQTLAESSRAIARGDFSRRVQLKSRTEIGELAQTFNNMTAELERFVNDLQRAADENRTLFMSSIQMLAGAVDEKDPYTRGHSDRVTRYSVLLAKEMNLPEEEVEKIRIAAQLHDVGKIGIEDRILKKPGALTPEEYEIMKTHTVKGASILRPVEMLKEMISGIELHHESLDGRGYPYGLKGEQIPLLPRIISVADTFDAMTTNRPYQAAMDPEYVVRIINSMANTKFDPRVVAALSSVFQRGGLRLHRAAVVSAEEAESTQTADVDAMQNR